MWVCSKCGRIFKKTNQAHSCKKIPLESHFLGKQKAKKIFNYLLEQIDQNIGSYKIISIPCCVHLFGKYDFLAALPKKNSLEVRIALGRKLNSKRVKNCVLMSTRVFKNCFEISSNKELDGEFIGWLRESYHLKD